MHTVWENAVEAFQAAMSHHPENVEEWDQYFASMGEAFGEFGTATTSGADAIDSETPVEHEVAEYLREVGSGFSSMSDAGGDVYQVWRQANEHDIRRHEEPRPNEASFNV